MANQAQKALRTDEPNVTIPLVASYNTRGIDAEDNAFSDLVDQRKINCLYEIIHNSLGNKITAYLVKRPGVTDKVATYGTATQIPYLVDLAPSALAITDATHWIFSVLGNDKRVSDSATTIVIDSTVGYTPTYFDKTIIANADTGILHLRNATGNHRTHYSTTIATWAQITDADYTSLIVKGKPEFIDGYMVVLTSKNRIYNSELNTLSTWDDTNFLTKQIVQDTPVALARLNKLIIAFGLSTMEVFHNVGNATGSPFENQSALSIKGIGMSPVDGADVRHYYAIHNNWLYFIGHNPIGVYAYNGEKIEKVSSSSVDKILASGSWYNVSLVAFSGQHAICIALDSPSTVTQDSLLFFPDWKDWFQWQSTVFQPVTSQRLGRTFLGIDDNNTGHILYDLSQSADNWQDDGTDYTETVQFKIPTTGNPIQRMRMAGVVGDTARAASSLNVQFSRDDGINWTTARTIDMTSPTKRLMSCGAFRNCHVRLSHTGNEENRLEFFIARIE